jgi:hypothetical protein
MIKRNGWDEYSKEKIQTWNTRELLAHFENIRAYRQNALKYLEDIQDQLKEAEWDLKLYDSYLAQLKDVLSTREHIPNKQEAKVIRQETAKAKQNR